MHFISSDGYDVNPSIDFLSKDRTNFPSRKLEGKNQNGRFTFFRLDLERVGGGRGGYCFTPASQDDEARMTDN